jgi:uncharacterized protein (DUF2235 family)
VRKAEVHDQQIERRQVRTHQREEIRRALHRDRTVAGPFEGAFEAVANERGIVGDENGLGSGGS